MNTADVKDSVLQTERSLDDLSDLLLGMNPEALHQALAWDEDSSLDDLMDLFAHFA